MAEEVAQEGGAQDDDAENDEALAAGLALTKDWPWLSQPELKLSNLREVKVLGRGAFGLVRCVRDKATGNEYALKALAKPAVKASSGGRGLEKMVRERDAQVSPQQTVLQAASARAPARTAVPRNLLKGSWPGVYVTEI